MRFKKVLVGMTVGFFALVSIASAAIEPLPQFKLANTRPEVNGIVFTWDRDHRDTASPANASQLFKFKRTFTQNGDTVDVRRMFSYLDGRDAVLETVQYKAGRVVAYGIEYFQTSEKGTATIEGNKVKFSFKKGADSESTGEETLSDSDPTLVGENIPEFISMNWDALTKEDDVDFRLVVPERTETVGFTLSKEKDIVYEGKEAVVVKMSPTSIIINMIVKPLYFTVEKAGTDTHKLLKYEGRTKPKLQVGNAFKDLDALTIFD